MKLERPLILAVAAVITIVGAIFAARFIIGGSEDSWICQNSQWVKHGSPSVSRPTSPCGQATANKEATKSAVPPLTEESFIRIFFTLINEKLVPDAISMMDTSLVPNDSAKQAWGVQFNSFQTVAVKEVKPVTNWELTQGKKVYQVTVVAKMSAESAAAPIPHFGWDDGENVRWITLVSDAAGQWKIGGIATGP